MTTKSWIIRCYAKGFGLEETFTIQAVSRRAAYVAVADMMAEGLVGGFDKITASVR